LEILIPEWRGNKLKTSRSQEIPEQYEPEGKHTEFIASTANLPVIE